MADCIDNIPVSQDMGQDGKNYVTDCEDGKRKATSAKQKSFRERWKDKEYRKNVWKTVWLGLSFWGLGFSVGQRGPAFLDIQIITGTDVEKASFFFTASSVGYLLGSLVAGVIYDLLNKSLLFLMGMLGLAACTFTLPWCSIYELMIVIHLVTAFFQGVIDTSGNAELVRIWGKEGEVAMQFIHFAFAFGGVISPLVTEPFLTPNPEDDMNTDTTTTTTLPVDNFTNMQNSTLTPYNMDNSTLSTPLTTNVHYAFMISGGIILLIAVPLTVQFFLDRSRKRRQDKEDEKQARKQPLPLAWFLFVQGTLCLFYLLHCAVEDTYGSFLTTFVVKQLHWSKSSGAQLTSLYWASFSAGRFLCIFLVHILTSVKLLALSCVSLFTAMVTMLLLSTFSIDAGLWVAGVFVGLAMAPIFPSGFTWMEHELVRVTGRVSSSILITASSGMIINPIIVGYLMQEVTPLWFTYLLVVQSAMTLSVFFFLLALSRLYLRKHYALDKAENVDNVLSLSVDETSVKNSTA